MIITESIAKLRKAKKMTQGELAVSAGISQSSISMYESGERTPSLPSLVRIAAALNCTVDDLIEKESA